MAEAPKRVQGPAIDRCATHTIKTLVDKQIRNFWQSKLSGNIHCQLWNHLDYEEETGMETGTGTGSLAPPAAKK